jgi:hypothetical protein
MTNKVINAIAKEMHLSWSNCNSLVLWYWRLAHGGPTSPARIGEAYSSEEWHAKYEEAHAEARELARAYWFARQHPAAAEAIYDFGVETERDGHHCY